MSIFKDKVLLITGGTGSFGNAVLRRFLDSDIKEIRILSRDEKKQDDMRHFLQANRSDVAHKVKFYIGNVRNRQAVDFAMSGVDYVFAAAALKQVPSCEFFPMEAVRTNVEGTNNVLLSAIARAVKNVVELSTDKKDPKLEKRLEKIFAGNDIYWNKSETWIDSERMYEVLYELTL